MCSPFFSLLYIICESANSPFRAVAMEFMFICMPKESLSAALWPFTGCTESELLLLLLLLESWLLVLLEKVLFSDT